MTARGSAGDGVPPSSRSPRVCVGIVAVLLVAQMSGMRFTGRHVPPLEPGSAVARLRLDPNGATRDELMLLPGIGPALGDAIIRCRNSTAQTPVFRSADDLDRVPGIGAVTIDRLRPHLQFGGRLAPPRDAGP